MGAPLGMISVDDGIRFVYVLSTLYTILIFVYVLLSWVQLPYSSWLGRFRGFLYDTVEPYVRAFRSIIPPIGGIDLSPILAVVALQVVSQILIAILVAFS